MTHWLSLLATLLIAYLTPCVMTSLHAVEPSLGWRTFVGRLIYDVNLPILALGLMVAMFRARLHPTTLLAAAAGLGLLLDGLSAASQLGQETITCTLLMLLCLTLLPARETRPWHWLAIVPLLALLHGLPQEVLQGLPAGWQHLLLREILTTTFLAALAITILRLPQVWFETKPAASLHLENRWSRLTPE